MTNNTEHLTILVVEDDKDLRRILSIQFAAEGFGVREADNGATAFDSLQEEIPDCVVLDLMMPVMDGFSFLKRIRSIDHLREIPVIILTALEDDRQRIRGEQYQADAYLSKPYNLPALCKVVRQLCSSAQVLA